MSGLLLRSCRLAFRATNGGRQATDGTGPHAAGATVAVGVGIGVPPVGVGVGVVCGGFATWPAASS